MKARRNDYWIMLGSLCLAVLLWVYVNGVQAAPERTVTVKLSAVGLPSSLVATGGLPGRVSVRIQDRFDLNLYSGQAFSAVVDLSGAKLGDNVLPVQVAGPFGVKVIKVIPAQVAVTVDRLAERRLPVQVRVRGTVAAGYRAGMPSVRPALVEVQGPAAVLAQLAGVPVTVDLAGAKASLAENLPVEASGNDISVSPARVAVSVPVVEESPVKVVPVVVQIVGAPAAGYRVGSITVLPDTITLYGSPPQLAGVTFVDTVPVAVTDYNHDLLEKAALKLPVGVNRVDPEEVRVQVQVQPVGGQAAQPAGQAGSGGPGGGGTNKKTAP